MPHRRLGAALKCRAPDRPVLAVLALKFQDGPSIVTARELQPREVPLSLCLNTAPPPVS